MDLRSVGKVFKCIWIASLLWLADTFLLGLFTKLTFVEAFWEGVTHARLMFRLILIIIVLGVGITTVLHREFSYMWVQQMRPTQRALLYGDTASNHKSCRLLYHCLRMASVMKLSAGCQNDLRNLCHCYDLGRIAGKKKDDLASRSAAMELGAAIAANIPQLSKSAYLIACQQEYYCGGGSRELTGKRIPVQCRIFTLAMLYDDLTHGEKAMEHQEAMDELTLYSGTMLDPDILEIFRRLHSDNGLAVDAAMRLYVQ